MGAGRPLKYKTPELMQTTIDLYFLACRVHQEMAADIEDATSRLSGLTDDEMLIVNGIEDTFPSISGLAYTLGMSTEALRNYEQKDEFLATVKRAKQRVEMSLEQRLSGKAVVGSIFSLKNNFGWKDKTEQEIKQRTVLESKSDEEIDNRIRALEDELRSQD
jgi:hypothetical protein